MTDRQVVVNRRNAGEICHAARLRLNHEGHEGGEASRLDGPFGFRDLLGLRRLKDFVSFVPFVPFVVQYFFRGSDARCAEKACKRTMNI